MLTWERLLFDGKLHFAPIRDPRNVLDAGTGTGAWVLDFAHSHPECRVFGVDVMPVQPSTGPPNAFFEVRKNFPLIVKT